MGLNNPEAEHPASLADFLMTRPIPDHIAVNICTDEYLKLVEDVQANRNALISIVEEYDRIFAEEDLIENEIGPYQETDPNIPIHLLAWFDRQNLKKMIDGAIHVINCDINITTIHSTTSLVAAYYGYAKSGLETDLGMILDLETARGFAEKRLDELKIETREPETLEEKVELKKKIRSYQECSEAAQKKVTEKMFYLKLALQAQHYLTSLSLE